jgi:hypothetical protein
MASAEVQLAEIRELCESWGHSDSVEDLRLLLSQIESAAWKGVVDRRATDPFEQYPTDDSVSYEVRRKVKVPGQRHYCSAKGCWNLATSGEWCGLHADQSQPNPQK